MSQGTPTKLPAKSRRRQCIEGVEKLLALGYSQAQYARMFDANTATVNQWIRYGRVGAWIVGRVKHIPELRNKITIKQLRPDLTPEELARTKRQALAWSSTQPKRVKEIPGVRLNAAKTPLSKPYRTPQPRCS